MQDLHSGDLNSESMKMNKSEYLIILAGLKCTYKLFKLRN